MCDEVLVFVIVTLPFSGVPAMEPPTYVTWRGGLA